MKKSYVIYNLKLAHELLAQGFRMTGSSYNRKYPQYMVYYFEDTEELRHAVEKYKASL